MIRAGVRAAALALVAGSCTPDSAPSGFGVTRDSAGIRIIENVSPGEAGVPEWSFRPVLDIGESGGDGPTAFYQVMGAVLLSDGRIAVADGGSSQIRFFDGGGSFLGATGRRGGGPGEFRRIGQLLRGPADSLFVRDDDKTPRVTVITGAGAIVRQFPLPTAGAPGVLLGRLPDGEWLASSFPFGTKSDTEPGLSRRPAYVIRVPADGGSADTLGAFPGEEFFFQVGGKKVIASAPPFARTSNFALAEDRLFVSTGDAPEVREYRVDGPLLRIIRTGLRPVAVTPQTMDAWVRERVARLPQIKMPADRTPEQAIRASIEGVPIPETLPPLGTLVADSTGDLWVGDYPDPATPSGGWTVYGPDGAIRARVHMPAGFRIFSANPDYVLGVVTDALDVEHVRLYRRR